MSISLHNQVLTYLDHHNVMTLATTGPEGLWAAAVFYVNDGFTLYFLSAPTTRHSINLASHSEVAATIQEDYQDWLQIKGIQLEGKADRIKGIEQAKVIRKYSMKFPIIGKQAPTEIAKAMSKIAWYRVEPKCLYFVDNSLGLGHRDVILLDGIR